MGGRARRAPGQDVPWRRRPRCGLTWRRSAAGLSVSAVRPTSLAVSAAGARHAPASLARRASATRSTRSPRRPARSTAVPSSMSRETRSRGGLGTSGDPRLTRGGPLCRYGLDVPTLPARPARPTVDTPAHRWLAARLGAVSDRLGALSRAESRRTPTPRRGVVLVELGAALGARPRPPGARRVRIGGSTAALCSSARAPAVAGLCLGLRRAPSSGPRPRPARGRARRLDPRPGRPVRDVGGARRRPLRRARARSARSRPGRSGSTRSGPTCGCGAAARTRSGWSGRASRWRSSTRRGSRRRRRCWPSGPTYWSPSAEARTSAGSCSTPSTGATTRPATGVATGRRVRRRTRSARSTATATPSSKRPRVDRAVALFPGTADGAFYGSRLWTSLDTLGVGAVPLRPGDVGALDAFIGGLVAARLTFRAARAASGTWSVESTSAPVDRSAP